MLTMVVERNQVIGKTRRTIPLTGARREVCEPFMAPQGNFGLGAVALTLRGWRPREIKPRRSPGAQFAQGLAALARRFALWRERLHTRQALLALGDRELRDIGLDRASAHRQGSLPFWRGE